MSEPRVQRRLAAILAADVVGYSRLMGEDEGGTLKALKSRRQEILNPLLAQHNGRLVKVMGDGVLAEFASAVDAVQCALALQEDYATANQREPAGKSIVLRIGINLGEVVVEGDDIYGDGVNIAARLEGLAQPGGICVAGKVVDEVRGKIAAAFEAMGPQHLKNITEPIKVYRVGIGTHANGTPASNASAPIIDRLSIAVLPFQNMSTDPEQQYFADGMVEDIITALSRFKSLFVIARNSSFIYKGAAVDVKKVGRELGVGFVLEGSVRRSGEKLRVTTQLINAANDEHVWAERYDASISDIFEVQDNLARTIAATLEGRIAASASDRARRKPTHDWRAYDHFLHGREHDRRYDLVSAERCFARAIELDPQFAQAYAFRAIALSVMRWGKSVQWGTSDSLIEEAEACANTAISIDPYDPLSHQAMGYVAVCKGDFELGGTHLHRARDLNPNDTLVVADLANWYTRTGNAEKALQMLEETMRRDPFPPGWIWEMRFRALFHLGEYEAALKALNSVSNLTSTHWQDAYYAAALGHLGRLGEAHAALERYLKHFPDGSIRTLSNAEPYASDVYREQLLEGLRKAGLRE